MGKRLDPNIAEQRLKLLINRNIKCLDSYKGSTTKHTFQCIVKNCNHKWEAAYYNVVNSNKRGCPKCCGNYVDLSIRHEKLDALTERNILCCDAYTEKTTIKTKLLFRCLLERCNHTWWATYDNVIHKKSGCPRCCGQFAYEEDKIRVMVKNRVRSRINASLRPCKQPSFSNFHSDDLLAYCQKEYITILPQPDLMTLDHILPLDFFNPTNDLEMKLCWNRRNLRWITQSENSKKKNKIIFDLFDDWHYLVYNLVSSGDYDTELAKSLLD